MTSTDKEFADKESAVSGMTRKEFLQKVVKRAAIAGAVVAAPKVVDKFLVPPVYAKVSLTTPPGPGVKHDPG